MNLPFRFDEPLLLLMLPLLLLAVWASGRGSLSGLPTGLFRTVGIIRAVVIVLLVLTLARIYWVRSGEGLMVLVLRDLSASVPREEGESALENLRERIGDLSPPDQVGLVSFGREASEEQPPGIRLEEEGIPVAIDRSGTDLAGALRLATSVFESAGAEGGRRIVLVSDGNSTEGDELLEARNLAAAGVVIDVLPVQFSYSRETLVESVVVPTSVRPEQPYDLQTVIWSSTGGPAEVVLTEDDKVVERRQVELTAGKTRLSFPMRHDKPGRHRFRVGVYTAEESDSLPGNNQGFGSVEVAGDLEVLIVRSGTNQDRSLVDALLSARVGCLVVEPREMPSRLEEYLRFGAILLDGVSAFDLGRERMEMLDGLVRSGGIGLVMIGGPETFGAGGYRGTPLEALLPVDLDVRRKKDLPNGALALVLHTCEFAQGNLWARRIAISALDPLTPGDFFGLLIYDGIGRDRWAIPMTPVTDASDFVSTISRLQPRDMLAFDPSMRLALTGLVATPASSRHVVIISDGDPAPPTAQTMQGLIDNGISVSTIGINPHRPQDTAILKKIAQDTGGRFYIVSDPRKLPQIFFREAIEVKRNLIREERFSPRIAEVTAPIRGLEGEGFPPLQGHVLTSRKPLAATPLVSDEDDPVLAHWRYGLGKTAAFTSDASKRWAPEWIAWPGFSTFWAQLVRHVSRELDTGLLQVRHQTEGEEGLVVIDAVDGEGRFVDGLELQGEMLDPEYEGQEIVIHQTGPGRYQGRFRAAKEGGYLLRLDYRGDHGLEGGVSRGFSVGYPMEYRQLRSDVDRLRELAEVTGGRLLGPEDDLLDRRLPVQQRPLPIGKWLLPIALSLFFIDIFLRRVQLPGIDWKGRGSAMVESRTHKGATAGGRRWQETGAAADESQARPKVPLDQQPGTEVPEEPPEPGAFERLLDAKKRARRFEEGQD